LRSHPRITKVYHPAFYEDQTGIQRQNMLGHSGVFSICVAVDEFEQLLRIANRLEVFGRAVSWGGVESLVMTGHKTDPGKTSATRVPMNLLRLSIGLEGADNLVADLERALS
jgi:cystathionine beta-lyase/cystathionine gamma-synthase